MESCYDVYLGPEIIGEASVRREGLYYRIRCHCRLTGESLCRVTVRCGQTEENLGVLVPQDEAFGLETRVPVKKLGEGNFRFSVVPRHKPLGGLLLPLYPEEPFRYLSRLKNAYLENRSGQVSVVIKEPDRPS